MLFSSGAALAGGIARRRPCARFAFTAFTACALAGCAARSPDATHAAATHLSSVSVINPDGRSSLFNLRHQAGVGEATVAGSPTEVWAVLPSVFAHLDIDVTRVDASAASMGTTGSRVRRIEGERLSRFLDCGRGAMRPFADEYEVTLSVIVQVLVADAGATKVRTLVDAYARDRTMSSGPVHCISSGTLERRVGELVAERLDG